MFAPTRYISWAMKFYGKVPLDLATSGMPTASWAELGIEQRPNIDDMAAFPRLIASIAQYNDVPPSDVTPALGTSHALFLAYASMLEPGDEIVVEDPGYEPLTRAAEGLGATVRTFERRASENFRIVPERVAALISPRTRAIVITTLHNPSGVRATDKEIRELAKIADAHGAYVLVDEVYAPFDELAFDGVFKTSARKLAPNIVAVGSLTKCYGLGMYRIGWVLGPPEINERAASASVAVLGHLPLTYASYADAALSRVAILSARAKKLMANKRELASQWASSLTDAQWSAPGEGLFGLVTLPGRGDLRERIEANAERSGVLVGAGSFFGAPESFRLSWATCDAEKFARGLELLAPLVS